MKNKSCLGFDDVGDGDVVAERRLKPSGRDIRFECAEPDVDIVRAVTNDRRLAVAHFQQEGADGRIFGHWIARPERYHHARRTQLGPKLLGPRRFRFYVTVSRQFDLS